MLILEVETELDAAEILRQAREFFLLRLSPYAAFVEDEGPAHLKLTTEAGELVLGVGEAGARRRVRGSTSRLHNELSQFLATLAVPEAVRQNVEGPGVSGAG